MSNFLLKYLKRRAERWSEVLSSGRVRESILEAIPFWIAALLSGLIAVAYTRLFNMSEGMLHQLLGWHKWMIFIMAPVGFLAAWLVVQTFSTYARGSGIPQVMAAIELSSPAHEKSISKLLSFRVIVTKIASSIFMVLGGGAIGREGPTIQVAGSVFRIVNRLIPKSWPKLSQKSFFLTGAAAGLAAAFNTPLGGIVFVIEELAKIHMSFFRTALFTSVIIAGLTAQGFLGPYLYLGYPDVKDFTPFIFLGVAVCAVITGMSAAYMGKAILKVMQWKKRFSVAQSVTFVLVVGLIVATIAFFLNVHIIGSGKDLMNETLFTAKKNVGFQTVVARILGPILAFTTGGAGGIFAPSLAAGASVGGFLSGLLGMAGANANILILSGMVGFLTGVTRSPFTSAILVLEMTDRHNVIFQLMLAALAASMAAMMIEKEPLYEVLKEGYLEEVRESEDEPHNELPLEPQS